jgi:hypothetical protein
MSKRIPMTTNTDVSKISSTSDSYSNSSSDPKPEPKKGLSVGTILLFILAILLGAGALYYKLSMWSTVSQTVFRK